MSPRRLRLEGDVLDELITLARTRYGPDARIVSVERVTVGGLFGFLASRHFEVTVELPDPVSTPAAVDVDARSPLGLAALIESAELAEATVQDVAPSWRPSTASADFDELLDSLTFQTRGAENPPPRILNPGSFEPDSGQPPG